VRGEDVEHIQRLGLVTGQLRVNPVGKLGKFLVQLAALRRQVLLLLLLAALGPRTGEKPFLEVSLNKK
jgi:hypothetical protein